MQGRPGNVRPAIDTGAGLDVVGEAEPADPSILNDVNADAFWNLLTSTTPPTSPPPKPSTPRAALLSQLPLGLAQSPKVKRSNTVPTHHGRTASHTIIRHPGAEERDEAWFEHHRGWLEKRNRGGVQGWLKRYFVISVADDAISYYKNDKALFPMGYIPLRQIIFYDKHVSNQRRSTLQLGHMKGKMSTRFEIVMANKMYELRADNARAMDKWLEAIGQALHTIKRADTQLPPRPRTPELPSEMQAEWQRDSGEAPVTNGDILSPLALQHLRINFTNESDGTSELESLVQHFPTENSIMRDIMSTLVHYQQGETSQTCLTESRSRASVSSRVSRRFSEDPLEDPPSGAPSSPGVPASPAPRGPDPPADRNRSRSRTDASPYYRRTRRSRSITASMNSEAVKARRVTLTQRPRTSLSMLDVSLLRFNEPQGADAHERLFLSLLAQVTASHSGYVGSSSRQLYQWMADSEFFNVFTQDDYLHKDLVLPLCWIVFQARAHSDGFIVELEAIDGAAAQTTRRATGKRKSKISRQEIQRVVMRRRRKRKRQELLDALNKLQVEKDELLACIEKENNSLGDEDKEREQAKSMSKAILKFFKTRSKEGEMKSLPVEMASRFAATHVSMNARVKEIEARMKALQVPMHWRDRYIQSCANCRSAQMHFYTLLQKTFHDLDSMRIGVVTANVLLLLLVNRSSSIHQFGLRGLDPHAELSLFNRAVYNAGVWKSLLVVLRYCPPHVRQIALKNINGILQSTSSRTSLLELPGWQRHLFDIISNLPEDFDEDPLALKTFQYTMLIFASCHLHLFCDRNLVSEVLFPDMLLTNFQVALQTASPTNLRVPRTLLQTLISTMIAAHNQRRLELQGRWDWFLFLLGLIKEFIFSVPDFSTHQDSDELLKGLQLDRDVLKKAEAAATPIQLEGDQLLFEADDMGDQLYIVRQGQVRAFIRKEDGTRKTLATYGPGDFFGETALLLGTPRTASVDATQSGTRLLQLDKSNYDRFIEKAGFDCKELIMRTATQRLVENFRRYEASILSPNIISSMKLYAEVGALCELVIGEPGEVVFREGDPASDFYVIHSGEVVVTVIKSEEDGGDGKTPVEIGRLGKGENFGVLGLVADNAFRTAGITAGTKEKCVLLKMNRNNFLEFLRLAPKALKILKNLDGYKAPPKGLKMIFKLNAKDATKPKKQSAIKQQQGVTFRSSVHYVEEGGLSADIRLVNSTLQLCKSCHVYDDIDPRRLSPADKDKLKVHIKKAGARHTDVLQIHCKENFDIRFGNYSAQDQEAIRLIQSDMIPFLREVPTFLSIIKNRLQHYLVPGGGEKLDLLVEGFLDMTRDRQKVFSQAH